MADRIEQITVAIEGETLASFLWRQYRKPVSGMVARVYEANPGLSELPTRLPAGTVINIPIVDEDEDAIADIEIPTLWN